MLIALLRAFSRSPIGTHDLALLFGQLLVSLGLIFLGSSLPQFQSQGLGLARYLLRLLRCPQHCALQINFHLFPSTSAKGCFQGGFLELGPLLGAPGARAIGAARCGVARGLRWRLGAQGGVRGPKE